MATTRRSFFQSIIAAAVAIKAAPAQVVTVFRPKSTNTLWAQSEIVRQQMMPKWFALDWGTLKDFKPGVQAVSSRDFRIPFQAKERE